MYKPSAGKHKGRRMEHLATYNRLFGNDGNSKEEKKPKETAAQMPGALDKNNENFQLPPELGIDVDRLSWRCKKAMVSGPTIGKDGLTEIHHAVLDNNLNDVTAMAYSQVHGDSMRDLVSEDASKMTPLFMAVVSGFSTIAEVLVKSGASCQVQDSSGRWLNEAAVSSYDLDIIRCLMAHDKQCGPESCTTLLVQQLDGKERGQRMAGAKLLAALTDADQESCQTDKQHGLNDMPGFTSVLEATGLFGEPDKLPSQACPSDPHRKTVPSTMNSTRPPRNAFQRAPDREEVSLKHGEEVPGACRECPVSQILQNGQHTLIWNLLLAKVKASEQWSEETALVEILCNCLKTRYGRQVLCKLQADKGHMFESGYNAPLRTLLACLTNGTNDAARRPAILAMHYLILSTEGQKLGLPKIIGSDIRLMTKIMRAAINVPSGPVKIGLLLLLKQLRDDVPFEVRRELVEKGIMTDILSSSLESRTNSALQMASNEVMEDFVSEPRLAVLLLRQGLLAQLSSLCQSVLPSVRDQATNTFDFICNKAPAITWREMAVKVPEEEEEDRRWVQVSYLEKFIDTILMYRGTASQARLLLALWAAAEGQRKNHFTIFKLMDPAAWLQLLVKGNHPRQRLIALDALNTMVRIGTEKYREPILTKDAINTLLNFLPEAPSGWESEDQDGETSVPGEGRRMTVGAVRAMSDSPEMKTKYHRLAMSILGLACIDPGMAPRRTVQEWIYNDPIAVVLLCDTCRREEKTDLRHTAIFTLACLAFRFTKVRRTVHLLLGRSIEQTAATYLKEIEGCPEEAGKVTDKDVAAVMEALAISVYGRRDEANALRRKLSQVGLPPLDRLITKYFARKRCLLIRATFCRVATQQFLPGKDGLISSTVDALIWMMKLMRSPFIEVFEQMYVCRCVLDIIGAQAGICDALVYEGAISLLIQMLQSESELMAECASHPVAAMVNIDGTAKRQLMNACRLDSRIFKTLEKHAYRRLSGPVLRTWRDFRCYALPPRNKAAATAMLDMIAKRHGTTCLMRARYPKDEPVRSTAAVANQDDPVFPQLEDKYGSIPPTLQLQMKQSEQLPSSTGNRDIADDTEQEAEEYPETMTATQPRNQSHGATTEYVHDPPVEYDDPRVMTDPTNLPGMAQYGDEDDDED